MAQTKAQLIDGKGDAVVNNKLLVGTSTARTGYAGNTPEVQIEAAKASDSVRFGLCNNSNGVQDSQILLAKTRGTSVGSNTVVQDGDTLGRIAFLGADGTDLEVAAQISSQVDGTPGNNDMPGRLVFSTTADGASSPTERMRITNSGNVGINTTNPDPDGSGERCLGITGNSGNRARLTLQNTSTGTTGVAGSIAAFNSTTYLASFDFSADGATNKGRVTVYTNNGSGAVGGPYVANGGASWTSASDERYKDIIEPIANSVDKVSQLRAVIGKFKTDPDNTRRSFLIAQDVQAVFPEAVVANDPEHLGLNYQDLIPLLVSAIQEQQVMITELQAEVAALKAQ